MAESVKQNRIDVALVTGPLGAEPAWHPDGAGAVLCFDGVVRPLEDGKLLLALGYEAYSPMAQRQLDQLASGTAEQFNLIALRVRHSVGVVPVGGVSLRLQIAAKHRKPAIEAMDHFIDALKRDVPIWKRPVFDGGASGGAA